MGRLADWPARHPLVGQVRGRGLMIGIELVKNQETREPNPEARHKVIEKAFQQGLLVLGCGESTVRLMPPADHRAGHADIGARNPRRLPFRGREDNWAASWAVLGLGRDLGRWQGDGALTCAQGRRAQAPPGQKPGSGPWWARRNSGLLVSAPSRIYCSGAKLARPFRRRRTRPGRVGWAHPGLCGSEEPEPPRQQARLRKRFPRTNKSGLSKQPGNTCGSFKRKP